MPDWNLTVSTALPLLPPGFSLHPASAVQLTVEELISSPKYFEITVGLFRVLIMIY